MNHIASVVWKPHSFGAQKKQCDNHTCLIRILHETYGGYIRSIDDVSNPKTIDMMIPPMNMAAADTMLGTMGCAPILHYPETHPLITQRSCLAGHLTLTLLARNEFS